MRPRNASLFLTSHGVTKLRGLEVEILNVLEDSFDAEIREERTERLA